jgi:hypothetical protein
MPAKAGIQQGVNSIASCSLDPGFRRGDGSNFNKPLGVGPAILNADGSNIKKGTLVVP